MNRIVALVLLATACGGEATWSVEVWGEAFIEEGIPATEFVDGCTASFDRFEVGITQAALVDGDGEVVVDLDAPVVLDMVTPGPQRLAELTAPAGFYDTARFAIRDASSPALQVAGTVTCGASTVSYDLVLDSDTTYDCEPEDLTLVKGDVTPTQLTIHGDHLFYDSLESPDAVLRGQAWIDADLDADGILTREELSATSIATLGYDVGSSGDVADLFAYVEAVTRSLGHIDGEGHCATR